MLRLYRGKHGVEPAKGTGSLILDWGHAQAHLVGELPTGRLRRLFLVACTYDDKPQNS
jgi:hypothetical protein